SPDLLEREVNGFSIDSRNIKSGEVFFALAQPDYKNNGFNGDFADSHDFISDAFKQGAIAVVAHHDKLETNPNLHRFRDKLLLVKDGIVALQDLAAGVYQNWSKPIVGITGSAGKTTARELTAAVLRAKDWRVLSNEKNYNNGLGHPLTVLRIVTEGAFDAAVLEMGMSTPMREIERLCRITPPDVAVELNVLPVHLEHLGTIENIANAKAELVQCLKPNGTAILNADDFRVSAMREKSRGECVLTFGIENKADVFASNITNNGFGKTRFTLETPSGKADVVLKLAGKHNILNALAAAAVGIAFEMKPETIAQALSSVAPPPMRGEVLRFIEGFEVINDAYNSNPDALLSMVKTLVENGEHAKRKIVIAGEMLELGANAAQIHRETGAKIAETDVDVIFGVRGLAQNLVEGAKERGIAETRFFADADEAANEIINVVRAGDLLLIKGSRGVRTEKIINKLVEKFEIATS
ncbi:MAG: UDP-N-acetylmuramoyl-tripeptide--D-alanyl-D-alanine ligase, partial [Pyrinomonadaceae bacterium]|nr:UDP-N-acetylmuramoyl-tripeptide--D-alanyl-D-alanine ligase [Pyrinomonadaceae bacterium]